MWLGLDLCLSRSVAEKKGIGIAWSLGAFMIAIIIPSMVAYPGTDFVKRYLTLKTSHIHTLPIVILMPHSSCNCRCVMCDIWQGNANLKQLDEEDIDGMLSSFKQLGTRWVVMSGGEALMNPNLFQLCGLLKKHDIRITILSTGLLLEKYAAQIVSHVDEVILSLDGSQAVHDQIRRVPRAFERLENGIRAVKGLDSHFALKGRCVIQRLNFDQWPAIVEAAWKIGLDQISFLAADVSTDAFNRAEPWDQEQRSSVVIEKERLPELERIVEGLIMDYRAEIESGFIAESPHKLRYIYQYYAALHNIGDFPPVECNAPWVSAVVEADGTVRPCFFHRPMGNIRETPLQTLVNGSEEIQFRKNLDMRTNPVCRKCVCTLNLRPRAKLI